MENYLIWKINLFGQKILIIKIRLRNLQQKKIFLNLYNEAIYKNNIYEYYNNLEIQSYDFKTNYKIKNNIVIFIKKLKLEQI